MGRLKSAALASVALGAMLGWHAAAQAAPAQDVPAQDAEADVSALRKQLADQAAQLARQGATLDRQQVLLDQQMREIERLQRMTDAAMQAARATGAAPGQARPGAAPPPIEIAQVTPPPAPVGEAPPEQKVEVASVPEGSGVLTPRGHFVLEPQFNYTHGSTNRLVFRGVEIATGIQIGVIEASDADRNAVEGALDMRYGLTDRLEVEARAPYLYRSDRVTTLAQRDASITRTDELTGSHWGDVELAGRYQINSGAGPWPIFIAGLRVKSDTGSNPYTIGRDQFGAATKLATGSGFWGVDSSLTMLYPTDPAVIFAGIDYLNQIPRSLNRDVGDAIIQRVKPGESFGANAGFGFALNPRFSFSLGYKHTYIAPTKLVISGIQTKSQSLQVGQVTVGWAFQLTPRITITNTYAIGTTRDAPDMQIIFRIPIRF